MSLNFHSISQALAKEVETLNRLIYRSKNQHKSSLLFRKMVHLKRLLNVNDLSRSDQIRITSCARDLYIIASSDLSMGFFIPLCLCVLGISARVFYLIDKCITKKNENKIDEIFSKI